MSLPYNVPQSDSGDSMNSGPVLALLLCAVTFQTQSMPGAPVVGRRTTASLLQEAARLAHEAEQIQDVAEERVDAGADRKILDAAQTRATFLFAKAIDLWREARDFDRVLAGVEELTRLYSALGEYDSIVDRVQREEQFWVAEGDLRRQAETVLLLAYRQGQTDRRKEAIQSAARALELARSARAEETEVHALDVLRLEHTLLGNRDAAEGYERASSELRKKVFDHQSPSTPRPLTIPAQWLDLPGAPLKTETRMVSGVMQPVLVNRSIEGVAQVGVGCVVERDGKVAAVKTGTEWNRYIEPFGEISIFEFLDEPVSPWSDEKPRCEGAGRLAVTLVVFSNRTEWRADGTPWAAPKR